MKGNEKGNSTEKRKPRFEMVNDRVTNGEFDETECFVGMDNNDAKIEFDFDSKGIFRRFFVRRKILGCSIRLSLALFSLYLHLSLDEN